MRAFSAFILDELGYLPLTREEASLFFRLLVRRYERASARPRAWPINLTLRRREPMATATVARPTGLGSSLESFALQSAALGLATVSDHVKLSVLPVVLALAAAPGRTLAVGSLGTLGVVVDFLGGYSSCAFSDQELVVSCENTKSFLQRVQTTSKELEALRE